MVDDLTSYAAGIVSLACTITGVGEGGSGSKQTTDAFAGSAVDAATSWR
jgi:hypothetical protein